MGRLNRQLQDAAANGGVDEVKRLLTMGAKPGWRGKNNWTALHLAAQAGHVVVIQALLSAGSKVDAKDKWGVVPLHMAAFSGHALSVKALLKGGAEVDVGDPDGQNSLHRATGAGNMEVVSALLDAGANIEALTKGGMTPLFGAALGNHPKVVTALLAAGASRDAKAANGWTALDFAKMKGHAAVIEALRADPTPFEPPYTATLPPESSEDKSTGPAPVGTTLDSRGLAGEEDDTELFEVVKDVLVGREVLKKLKASESVKWGDLLVCRGRLIYSCLTSFSVPQEGMAGGTMSGLGLVDKTRQAVEGARSEASDERARRVGLSLLTRSRFGNSFWVRRRAVQSLRLHPGAGNVGGIEFVLANGEVFMMEVAGAAQLYDRLHLWHMGEPVLVSCDRQGMDMNLPLPAEMLLWIEDPPKSPQVNLDDCSRGATMPNYCKSLVVELKQRPWPQREGLCKSIKDRSVPLASSVGSELARSPWFWADAPLNWWESPLNWACGLGALGGITLASGLLIVLNPPNEGWEMILGGLLLIVCAGSWGGALIHLRIAVRDRRRNKQLAALLLGGPQSEAGKP